MGTQNSELQTQNYLRPWVVGLLSSAVVLLGVGIWMSSLIVGPARPWLGLGLFMSMGLAAVVGASKTSSA